MVEPRPISPTLRFLFSQLEDVRKSVAQTLRAVREANDNEAEASDLFRRAFAKAYVTAAGPTEMRRQLAILETADLHARLDVATGLRRSASEAADLRAKELEALTGAYNAYNRELKVEQQLAGAA